MNRRTNSNDLQEIVTQALAEMKQVQGENFSLEKINLAELERRTGLSRGKLRALKKNDFIVMILAIPGQHSCNSRTRFL